MTSIILILLAAGLLAGSGVPGLLAPRRGRWGELVAVVFTSSAAVLGLTGVFWLGAGPESLRLPLGLPGGDRLAVLDPLSRAFLVPVFLVPALGAIYGLGYWKQADHPGNGRKLRLFYGLMPAGMTLVLIAQDGVLFLLAWEIMALSAFFLVSTEDDQDEVRSAGWVYFVATHVGTLSLFAMFAFLRAATGSFALHPIDPSLVGPSVRNAIFILAGIGFGLKAGLMPLHVWLPGAHANAPSHVSAVLSGVMLKIGIYGLVRTTGLLPDPPAWWGGSILAVGAVSAVLGLALAIGQHDLKRLLAYSSIENVGIIAVGLGLAMLGRSTGQAAWAVLGLGGAILHSWNHCLFKPLLFFGAGSVLHGAGSRRIDQLGGLSKPMPRTAWLFLAGAVAICALPPLNGFVSELLIYLGLFRTLGISGGVHWPSAAAVIPVLALAGGLTAVAFTKLFGAVFLGQPRSEAARRAHECSPAMLWPMHALACLCFVLGAVPALAAPVIDRAVAAWWPSAAERPPSVLDITPLSWMPLISSALLGCSVLGYTLLRRAISPANCPRPGTWDCGYAAPGPRMQYTGSSYSQFLVTLFSWALLPRLNKHGPRGLFPAPARFQSDVPDAVLDRIVLPTVRGVTSFVRWIRLLQQGQIQVYVLYIILTVLVMFVVTYVL